MKKFFLILILPLLSNAQSLERENHISRSERHTNTDFRKLQTNFSDDNSRNQARLSAITTPVSELRLDHFIDVDSDQGEVSNKFEYKYDENENEVFREFFQWDAQTESFVPTQKLVCIYNENGDRTLATYYNWDTDTNGYVNFNRFNYIYNENGFTSLNENWDENNNSYVNRSKTVITYDENVTTSETKIWDTENNVYVTDIKTVITYDENDTIIHKFYYAWDEGTTSFLVTGKDEYIYDENERTYLVKKWNAEVNALVINSKQVTIYDENGSITSDINEFLTASGVVFFATKRDIHTKTAGI